MTKSSFRHAVAGAIALVLAFALSTPVGAQPAPPGVNNPSTELIPSVGHANTVTAIAYSPDGRFLASVGRDRAGRIWNGRTGALLRTLSGVGSPMLAVAFSADSRIVFTSAQNGAVQWWSADTGKRLGQAQAGGTEVTAAAIRPTGQRGEPLLVATANADHSISVARYKSLAAPPESLPVLKGHDSDIDSLQFSPDATTLASGGRDGALKIWDVEDGLLRHNLSSHKMPVRSLAFSPDGNTLADASEDGDTKRWDTRTGKLIGFRLQLNTPGDGVAAVAFGPDGKTVATGGRRALANKQSYLTIWDAGAEKLKQALVGHTAFVTALAFSPDGKRLASGSADHTVRIWNVDTGRQTVTSGVYVGVTSTALSRAGSLLASGSTDSAVRIWSLETGELLRILRGHRGPVSAVAFTTDGRSLFSAGRDGSLRLWNASNGALVRTTDCKAGEIRSMALSPDGTIVATGHRSASLVGAIELRDRVTGALLKTLNFQGLRPVEALAFSPDGTLLASGGGGGFEHYSELRLWNAKSGEQVAGEKISGSEAVMAVAFSPNGKFLATANDKLKREGDLRETFTGEVRIWNGQTLASQRAISLSAPETWANALLFLDDNRTLVSGGEDGLLRRWNVRTGEADGAYATAHLGAVAGLSISADGMVLASGGADNTVRLWKTKTSDLLVTMATLPASATTADGADMAPSTDWLAATPEGYYDGSANASRQIQWRVGPDLFPMDSYEAQRHRPEVLKQKLSTQAPPKPGPGGLGQIGGTRQNPEQSSTGPMPPADRIATPPQITFLEPPEGGRIEGDTLKFSGWATDEDEIASLVLQVNGRVLKAKHLTIGVKHLTIGVKHLTIGVKSVPFEERPIPAGHKYYQPFEGEVQLPATDDEVVVTAVAVNKSRLSSRQELRLTRSQTSDKGVLHVLAIGVSQYKNPAYNLKYARSDAEAFTGMWQRHSGSLYKEVRVTQLTDEKATADNIRAALFKLAEQATSSDCVAIFLSGHGVQDGERYYFATQEIEPARTRLDATALPWTALQTALSTIPARRVILFLDACHAGNALGPMQANSDRFAEALVKRAGVMVFASSRGAEYSYELDDVKHGAFTQALLEGIGEAKANLEIAGQRADSISAEDLLAYLRRRVPQLTANRQTPSCPLIRDFGDAFPLVRVR